VTAPHFIHDLNTRFVKKELSDEAYNEINTIVRNHKCRLNIMDQTFNNKNSIDDEPDRVNVRVDKDFVITSITIG
jgi:hypothetical protein